MDFTANKQAIYQKRIANLADQPNMQPNELKSYFDSSPEELRQAHNGLCDALTQATGAATAAANLGFQSTAGVPADNVQDAIEDVQAQLTDAVLGNIPSGSVTEDKLAQDVRDRFTAIESAATAEASARASADSQMQSQISTHTTQIAQKCEVYIGTYTGDDAAERTISLGFTPKAVLLLNNYGCTTFNNNGTFYLYGGMAVSQNPVVFSYDGTVYPALEIVNNGFKIYETDIQISKHYINTNLSGIKYIYLAIQ